jgi:hypothetical protein
MTLEAVWRSGLSRQAHNLKIAGSNPATAPSLLDAIADTDGKVLENR